MTKPENINTVLLDLDGTLLQVDLNVLIPTYINKLSSFFSDLVDPKLLSSSLYATTRITVENQDPKRTNEEVFFEDFTRRINLSEQIIRPRLEQFYAEEFPRLQTLTSPHPYAKKLLDVALRKNLDIVIATNPVFPRVAIEERLRWAGLSEYPFKLITNIENMHFCKPNPQYYREITVHLSCSPASCMMAGNDVTEDLSAAQVGMLTYLVEDTMENAEHEVPKSTRRGLLQDLVQFISDL